MLCDYQTAMRSGVIVQSKSVVDTCTKVRSQNSISWSEIVEGNFKKNRNTCRHIINLVNVGLVSKEIPPPLFVLLVSFFSSSKSLSS